MDKKLKNKVRQYIEREWPSALAFGTILPNYMITEDPTFTKERTGAGSIEYFNEPYINYGTEENPNIILNPNGEIPTLLYNPNTNTADDVKLDLLHHYREYDPVYLELLRDYEQSILSEKGNILWNSLLGEIFREKYNNDDLEYSKHWDEWDTMVNTTPSNSLYMLQGVDGSLRNLLASDATIKSSNYAPREVAEQQWLSNPEARKAFNNILSYLTSYRLPEVTVLGNRKNDGGPLHPNWSELSMKERAAYIRMGVASGYKDIDSIKLVYNEFRNGGNTLNPPLKYIYDELPRLLREAGLDVRVSSGYRKAGAVGTAGNRSWHPRHGAVDIVPLGNTTFEDIEYALHNNPVIRQYMLSNNFGLLDESGRTPESRATMHRTGATGPHFHIGRDSKPAALYRQRVGALLQADGNKVVYFSNPFTPIPLDNIQINTPVVLEIIPSLVLELNQVIQEPIAFEGTIPEVVVTPNRPRYIIPDEEILSLILGLIKPYTPIEVSKPLTTTERLKLLNDNRVTLLLKDLEDTIIRNNLLGIQNPDKLRRDAEDLRFYRNMSALGGNLFEDGGELGNYYDGFGDAWNFLKRGVQKARQKVKDWGLDKSPAEHLIGLFTSSEEAVQPQSNQQEKVLTYRNRPAERVVTNPFEKEGRLVPIRQRSNTSKTTKEESEQLENMMRSYIANRDGSVGSSNPEYDIPYIPEKAILINGSTTSTNVLDSLAKYAGIHNRNPLLSQYTNREKSSYGVPRLLNMNEMLGLSTQETHNGAIPAFNYAEDNTDKHRALNIDYKDYNRALGNTNYFTAFGYIPAENLVRNFQYNNAHVNRTTPPLLDAFRYYAQGDYNTKDPKHTLMVNEAGKEAWKNPEVKKWWNNSGKYWYNTGKGPKKALGGNLFSGEENHSSQMNIFRRPNGEYFYQASPESEEITVTPLNTMFENPALWTYTDANGKLYTPRQTATTNQGTIVKKENEGPIVEAAKNYLGELLYDINNGIPIGGKYTMPAIAAAAALPIIGEAVAPILSNPYVDAGLTSAFAAHGLNHAINGGINGWGDAAMTALELSPLVRPITKASETGYGIYNNILDNYPILYLYPRYVMGKLKYGFDAELPTLYRKVKTLPRIEDGNMQISTPNSRFAYDNGYGSDSPVITNMTTDAPVRSHSSGNWDRGLTLAFPGKTLLGKHVISTRPSDTFTFGDNISVPISKVTAFSGRPKEISFMEKMGANVVTSPETKLFWESGVENLEEQIAKARLDIEKINRAKASGDNLILLRPKNPIDNFENYARSIEDLTRETYKSPTMKDYLFMDYVFRPRYNSLTAPIIDNFTFDLLENNPDTYGSWLGDLERRKYLEDLSRWLNLMYDPLTPVESEFRRNLNIGLKPEYKR